MNVFVFYLLMHELFIDEIHFFKFPYMNDKQWLDQLKIITNFHGTSFSESFHPYKEVEYQHGGEILYSKNIYEASVTYQAH